MRNVFLAVGLLLAAVPLFTITRREATPNLEQRRTALNGLIADEWEYEMRESPEFATVVGDYRYNDQWSDGSLAHVRQQRADLQNWLSRFEAVDTAGFPEQEQLNQALMVRNLKLRIQGIDLKTFEMPIDQFFGAHLQIAQFVSYIPFTSTKQYEDYLARLRHLPVVIDQIIEVLQQGAKDKLLPPRYLLEKTVQQSR